MNDPLARLVGELSRLPGVGPKTATRLAHHLLRTPRHEAETLCTAILEVKDRLFHCSVCHAITAVDPCLICTDPRRDQRQICVVEEPFNLQPIERTGEYHGLYHVLLGALSPQRGVGPDDLAIDSLLRRLEGAREKEAESETLAVEEIILATNPNVEGEATALYLARLIKPLGVRVTRIANGIPVGGDVEYVDVVTLGRALDGRREM